MERDTRQGRTRRAALPGSESGSGVDGPRPRRTGWIVALGCAGAAALATPDVPPKRPAELAIASDVRARLDVLAAGLRHEIVLCLTGRAHGRTAHAADLYMPVPHTSSANQVVTGPCPRGTLATWHNHPAAAAIGARRSPGAPGFGTPSGRGDTSGRVAPQHGSFDTVGRRTEGPDGWGTAGGFHSCRPSRRDVSTALRLRIPFLVIADGDGHQCVWSLAQLEALAD